MTQRDDLNSAHICRRRLLDRLARLQDLLSLGPSFVPFVSAILSTKARARATSAALKRVLRHELGHDGFPFAITLAVVGGVALRKHLWALLAYADQHAAEASPGLSESYTAQANAALLALALSQRTFLVVRAVNSIVQALIL